MKLLSVCAGYLSMCNGVVNECMFQMDDIVSKFGVVVCSRSGTDIDRFIYESDLLTRYKVFCFLICALIMCIFLQHFISIC